MCAKGERQSRGEFSLSSRGAASHAPAWLPGRKLWLALGVWVLPAQGLALGVFDDALLPEASGIGTNPNGLVTIITMVNMI